MANGSIRVHHFFFHSFQGLIEKQNAYYLESKMVKLLLLNTQYIILETTNLLEELIELTLICVASMLEVVVFIHSVLL